MRAHLCLSVLGATVASTFAADLPFDPTKPELLSPASVYAFRVEPRPGIAPATVRLHTESTDEFKDSAGKTFAPIGRISVVQDGKEYDLPYEYETAGMPEVEVADFDGDGFTDFRVLSNWGTGGSWYCYYRFKDGAYHRWSEPEELGLNGLPENGLIAAYNRSGPESIAVFYKSKDGRFQKQRVEALLLKSSLPELADVKTEDFSFVQITEEWDGNRLLKRTLEPQYSGE